MFAILLWLSQLFFRLLFFSSATFIVVNISAFFRSHFIRLLKYFLALLVCDRVHRSALISMICVFGNFFPFGSLLRSLSLSRAVEIVPFRFSVFDKFTECAPTEYIFASQYFSFVRWMVCIYRACIYNAHPHRITFTMFDVCQRVFRSLALCEIFAHINCEPESHAFRFGSQLNNKKSSS